MANSQSFTAYISSVIDGRSVGNNNIAITPDYEDNTFNFIPLGLAIEPVDVEDVTDHPVINVGMVSPNFNDIGSLNLETLMYGLPDKIIRMPESTQLVCRVASAAIATAYTFKVHVWGYLLNASGS